MAPTLLRALAAPPGGPVEAARDGDREAFAARYHQYWRMAPGILPARISPGNMEDLAQDVFSRPIAGWGGCGTRRRFPAGGDRAKPGPRLRRRGRGDAELPEDLPVEDPAGRPPASVTPSIPERAPRPAASAAPESGDLVTNTTVERGARMSAGLAVSAGGRVGVVGSHGPVPKKDASGCRFA